MMPTSRKRNPYSIEELLKKPEKKRKTLLVNDAREVNRDAVEEVCETSDDATLNVETCD